MLLGLIVRSGPSQMVQACERALFAGARAQGAGSRQQLRAAARRFVRRHRRDLAYLRWVLRTVAASSALAVSLLGLSAEPAQAKAPLFSAQTGAANPLDGKDVGSYSRPGFGDLDGDGDLDLVSHESGGSLLYYENTGTATSPAYVQRTGVANPLNGFNIGGLSSPVLGDVDADGDLDLITGAALGGFRYFENTGNARTPAFVLRTGSANPLNGQSVGNISVPTLGDLDGDGDLDLVAGEDGGSLRYFENTGTAKTPAYAPRTGAANPLSGQSVGTDAAPTLGDLDGDGDLDLVSGNFSGEFRYFENTGNATYPVYVARTGAANPLDGETVGIRSVPTLADVDGDGDLDLLSGTPTGLFAYFKNLAGGFVARTGAANPLNGLSALSFSYPALADLDQDGDLDLVFSWVPAHLSYAENTGSVSSPAFGSGGPLPGTGLLLGDYLKPTLGDLDHDGDLDVLSGSTDGTFHYFENTGTATSPLYLLRTGAANPLNGVNVCSCGTFPSLGDLDGDGDLDLVVGGFGPLYYFENTGTTASPVFVMRTGASNPLNGLPTTSLYTIPTLADVDGDGDLDVVAGTLYGELFYIENTGTRIAPRSWIAPARRIR